MSADERNKVFSVYPIFFCYAFFLSMLGQFVPYIRTKFGISLAAAGMLSTLQSIGGLVAVLLIILYVDNFNKIKVFAISGLLFSISAAIVGVLPILVSVYAMFLILGFINCMLNTLPNAIISDNALQNRNHYLNLLHAFFGVGGCIGSQLTNILVSATDMNMTFILYAVFVFLWVIVYFILNGESLKSPIVNVKESIKSRLLILKTVIKQAGMLHVGLIAFFSAFEMLNILYWNYTFVSKTGAVPSIAALGLTIFFLGLTISRFMISRFSHKISPQQVISYGSIAGLVVNTIICFTSNAAALIVLFGLLGLFMGSIFPQAFILSCTIAPKNTAFASGIVILGYFLASLIGPPLVGWIGDLSELKYGLLFNSVIYLPLGLLSLKFKRAEF